MQTMDRHEDHPIHLGLGRGIMIHTELQGIVKAELTRGAIGCKMRDQRTRLHFGGAIDQRHSAW